MKKQYMLAVFLLGIIFSGLGVAIQTAQAETMVCTDLKTNLNVGMSNTSKTGGIIQLQDFLRAQGYLSSPSTGYFGSATSKAVVSFQTKQHISAVGSVGPLTRAEIKKVSCATQTSVQTNTQTQQAAVVLSTPTVPAVPGITLPYKTELFSAWQGTWGSVSTTSTDTLSLKGTATASGAEAILPNSGNWTDYKYTVNVSVSNGDITLLSRYVDGNNFLACTFSGNWVAIQQRLNGETTTLASGTIPNMPSIQFFQKNITVSMRVKGNTAACITSISGDDVAYTGTDTRLSKGGIGIETWFQTLNVATLELRNVQVEAL